MRKAAIIGLCWTIFLAPMPTYGLGGDNASYPAGSMPAGGEICFPLPDGERILQNLESLGICRDAVEAADGAVNSCEVRATALEGRVVEQEGELKDARKLVDDTRKAGEEAAKASSGPWYARALSVVKWVALGIVIGFVGGMAK